MGESNKTNDIDPIQHNPSFNCGLWKIFVIAAVACIIALITSLWVTKIPQRTVCLMGTTSGQYLRKEVNWPAVRASILQNHLDLSPIKKRSRRRTLSNDDITRRARTSISSLTTLQISDLTESQIEFFIPLSRIKVGKRFAAGGGGQLCKGELDDELVALKELYMTMITGSAIDIVAEADMLMRLQHPNMVRFYGIAAETFSVNHNETLDDDEGVNTNNLPVYIVTEYCSGGDISDLVRSNRAASSSFLHLSHMLKYCLDLAKVMQFLHERPKSIVHLDLKPENLLLESVHPRDLPAYELYGLPKLKLCDLGVAKIQSAVEGIENKMVGTIMYMPPEMLQQKERLINGTSADVYSAAVTYFFMLASEIPFAALNLSDAQLIIALVETNIRPEIPATFAPEISTMLKLMWVENPDERITFQEVGRRLRNALSTEIKEITTNQTVGIKTITGQMTPENITECAQSDGSNKQHPSVPPLPQRIIPNQSTSHEV